MRSLPNVQRGDDRLRGHGGRSAAVVENIDHNRRPATRPSRAPMKSGHRRRPAVLPSAGWRHRSITESELARCAGAGSGRFPRGCSAGRPEPWCSPVRAALGRARPALLERLGESRIELQPGCDFGDQRPMLRGHSDGGLDRVLGRVSRCIAQDSRGHLACIATASGLTPAAPSFLWQSA
jgi:hypothetical protein